MCIEQQLENRRHVEFYCILKLGRGQGHLNGILFVLVTRLKQDDHHLISIQLSVFNHPQQFGINCYINLILPRHH